MVEVLTASETIRGSRGLQEFAHAPNVSACALVRLLQFLPGPQIASGMNVKETGNAGNAVAFQEHSEDGFGLLDGKVHSLNAFAGVREDLAALLALVTLAALALPEFPAFGTAVVARHG